MFCSRCGSQIADEAVVCPRCGVAVSGKKIPVNTVEKIPNHLIESILVTIFCCLPIGIVGIVYANKVNTYLALGDVDSAREASKKANMWLLIAAGCGAAFGILYGIMNVIAGN